MEINYFGKIPNVTQNSLKMSVFSGDFEGAKSIKSYEKLFPGRNYFRINFVSDPSINVELLASKLPGHSLRVVHLMRAHPVEHTHTHKSCATLSRIDCLTLTDSGPTHHHN